jgi:hypothetical protein
MRVGIKVPFRSGIKKNGLNVFDADNANLGKRV